MAFCIALKPVNIPKITILVDHDYYPNPPISTLEEVYPQIMRKVRFERSSKPSKAEKAAAGKTGFVPVIVRWIWEHSNTWAERCKSLVKNFERTLSHANALINLYLARLMLKQLAANA